MFKWVLNTSITSNKFFHTIFGIKLFKYEVNRTNEDTKHTSTQARKILDHSKHVRHVSTERHKTSKDAKHTNKQAHEQTKHANHTSA